jgi:hypothetical protein
MNEPHDMNSVPDWVDTIQAAANAICTVVAVSQYDAAGLELRLYPLRQDLY